MRRVLIALSLLLSACVTKAEAQTDVPHSAVVEACVTAAGADRAALEACRGIISRPCMQTPQGETTGGLVQCYAAETAAWNALLESSLGRARDNVNRRGLLDSAHEHWLSYRQSECAYQASLYAGGSLARVLQAECFADLTALRAIGLIYAEHLTD